MAATGVTGQDLTRLVPIVEKLMDLFLRYDLTLAEINPLGKTEDGRFLVLDGHVDLEGDARGRHKAVLDALGIGDEETREARPPTPFEISNSASGAAPSSRMFTDAKSGSTRQRSTVAWRTFTSRSMKAPVLTPTVVPGTAARTASIVRAMSA